MKNKFKYAFLIIFLLMMTGCGSNDYIKDADGKILINEVTGQNLQKDIFCKPEKDSDIYKLYEQNQDQMKNKLEDLPDCKNFSITSNKTKSLWQGIFVKPIAYIILKLGYLFKKMGLTNSYLALSLIIIGLLIRVILLPFTIKTQRQSRRMQEAMPKIQRIEKKYAGRNDQESQMMKAQETMAVYKEFKVNPMSSCLVSLIQLPLFFAFLEAIYKIPAIYEGKIFSWNLGTTPSTGIFTNHNYSFIILIVLIILTTFFSFKITMMQTANNNAQQNGGKQMKYMLYFMTFFISFASFSLPTAIALYWIATYAFMIAQTLLMKFLSDKKSKKVTSEMEKRTKNIKEKIKEKEGMKYGKNK